MPIAVNVGDAMLSLSLQPLLDNVERVGLGPALRILRAVAKMTRLTVDGQALELEWVRSNTWRLDDDDYLKMVELKTSWYSFITPLQAGAIAAGAGPERLAPLESLGRHLGAAFQITDDLLNLRADPEEYGKEIGGDLWEGKRTLMLLHTLRCAEPTDQDRAVQILAKRRPSADGELGLTDLLDRLTARGELSEPGRAEIGARLQGNHPSESKSLNDIRWLYELMHRVGSLSHARDVAARPRAGGGDHAGRSRLAAAQPPPGHAGQPRGLRTRADPMSPEVLIGMLAELERIRELTLNLIERETPRLLPTPPDEDSGTERTVFDLLLGARRAVLGNPAAARGLHDLLVAEGRRYANTPDGARLRDALATSEAVENLRRVWETVSLNVLDGPAAPNAAPDAWAELLADAVIGHGLDDSILARLRPEGFA